MAPLAQAMTLDGRLDEPAWRTAQVFSNFRVTQPHTRAAPPQRTEARVLSQPEGIYIGILNAQPPETRVRTLTARDEQPPGDHVSVVVDFENRGLTAYEFTVSLAGGVRDGILNNQSAVAYDWDGSWRQAVAEDGTHWSVEILLPWTLAPMLAARDGETTIGLWVSRFRADRSQRDSDPPLERQRPDFVRALAPARLRTYAAQELRLFPYAAALRDLRGDTTDTRAGLDLFWKPAPSHQLTATLNPDFGQVESDQLVVNFSAIETFFADKRPFFTENQGLFRTENLLVNTRRIGAAPDAGPEGASDIRGALKYTGNSGAWDYGVFSALEDDSSVAEGRDFYVGRVRHRVSPTLALGGLVTHAQRPQLAREATVQALDAQWTPAPGRALSAQLMLSDVERPGAPSSARNPRGEGRGATLSWRNAPGGMWEQTLALSHFDRHLQINDLGFQARNNLNRVIYEGFRYFRDLPPEGDAQERSLFWRINLRRNNQGDTLPGFLIGEFSTLARDGGRHFFNYTLDGFDGVDDLITRGNGPVKKPPRHKLIAGHSTAPSARYSQSASLTWSEGVLDGHGWVLDFKPTLRVSDAFSLAAQLTHTTVPDELIWQRENLLGGFAYREGYAALNLDAFFGNGRELRLKFQWVGVRAALRQAYRSAADGSLIPSNEAVDDFSLADTGLQLRYRQPLAPLSELFLVYSRGGAVDTADARRNLGELFEDGLREETSNQFLIKLRYGFKLGDGG